MHARTIRELRPARAGSAASAEADEMDLRLEAVEKRHILAMLEAAQGNKSAATRTLGISRKTLERKLKAWEDG